MIKTKETNDCWVIRNQETDAIVFNYRTHQGNYKKGLFNSYKYAEEALNKYVSEPQNYYICKIV